MFTKTALIVALTLGTVAAASASNHGNRHHSGAATRGFQSSNVALGGGYSTRDEQLYFDRASASPGGAAR